MTARRHARGSRRGEDSLISGSDIMFTLVVLLITLIGTQKLRSDNPGEEPADIRQAALMFEDTRLPEELQFPFGQGLESSVDPDKLRREFRDVVLIVVEDGNRISVSRAFRDSIESPVWNIKGDPVTIEADISLRDTTFYDSLLRTIAGFAATSPSSHVSRGNPVALHVVLAVGSESSPTRTVYLLARLALIHERTQGKLVRGISFLRYEAGDTPEG